MTCAENMASYRSSFMQTRQESSDSTAAAAGQAFLTRQTWRHGTSFQSTINTSGPCHCVEEVSSLYDDEKYELCVRRARHILSSLLRRVAQGVVDAMPSAPFSTVSALLHYSVCSLLRLKSLEEAKECVRVWREYASIVHPGLTHLVSPSHFRNHSDSSDDAESTVGETAEVVDRLWVATLAADEAEVLEYQGSLQEATQSIMVAIATLSVHVLPSSRRAQLSSQHVREQLRVCLRLLRLLLTKLKSETAVPPLRKSDEGTTEKINDQVSCNGTMQNPTLQELENVLAWIREQRIPSPVVDADFCDVWGEWQRCEAEYMLRESGEWMESVRNRTHALALLSSALNEVQAAIQQHRYQLQDLQRSAGRADSPCTSGNYLNKVAESPLNARVLHEVNESFLRAAAPVAKKRGRLINEAALLALHALEVHVAVVVSLRCLLPSTEGYTQRAESAIQLMFQLLAEQRESRSTGQAVSGHCKVAAVFVPLAPSVLFKSWLQFASLLMKLGYIQRGSDDFLGDPCSSTSNAFSDAGEQRHGVKEERTEPDYMKSALSELRRLLKVLQARMDNTVMEEQRRKGGEHKGRRSPQFACLVDLLSHVYEHLAVCANAMKLEHDAVQYCIQALDWWRIAHLEEGVGGEGKKARPRQSTATTTPLTAIHSINSLNQKVLDLLWQVNPGRYARILARLSNSLVGAYRGGEAVVLLQRAQRSSAAAQGNQLNAAQFLTFALAAAHLSTGNQHEAQRLAQTVIAAIPPTISPPEWTRCDFEEFSVSGSKQKPWCAHIMLRVHALEFLSHSYQGFQGMAIGQDEAGLRPLHTRYDRRHQAITASEEFLLEALHVRRQLLGEHHGAVIAAYVRLGWTLAQQGRLHEALACAERCDKFFNVVVAEVVRLDRPSCASLSDSRALRAAREKCDLFLNASRLKASCLRSLRG